MKDNKKPRPLFPKESNNSNCNIFETLTTLDQKGKSDFCRQIAQKIKSTLSPLSVINIGYDLGFLVQSLRDIGIEAYSIDISKNNNSKITDDIKPYSPIGSDSNLLSIAKKYDLITCIGVLERLPEEEVIKAIQNMIRYSDTILLSSFPGNSENPEYINIQPPEYWVSIFGKFGYALDLSYNSSLIWPHDFLFRKRKYLDFSLLSRPLRIFILCSNTNDACAQIRLCRPLSHLEKQGKLAMKIFPLNKKHPPSFDNLDWADLVIFQRTRSFFWKPYLKYAKEKKIPVIYEIDDNLLELPPRHPQYSYWKKIKNNPKYTWYLRNADGITTTTRPLAYYLKKFNENVFLLPNYIDSTLRPTQDMETENKNSDGKTFTVGYAGSITHSYDFEPICSALKKINKLFSKKIQFHFIGFAPSKLLKETNLIFDGRCIPYYDYLNNLHQKKIDLGLAPLIDNSFNECKSNIKFLEYTLAGIPGVYSKVGPYKNTIKNGVTGFLVKKNNEKQWVEALTNILENPKSLNQIRANAQKFMEDSFMLKDHYREWWDTYLHMLVRVRGNLI